jgi:hypothetical protein
MIAVMSVNARANPYAVAGTLEVRENKDLEKFPTGHFSGGRACRSWIMIHMNSDNGCLIVQPLAS